MNVRSCRRRLAAWLMIIVFVPVTTYAQQTSPDSSGHIPDATTNQTLSGSLIDRLPVDRIDSALILLPGITPSRLGGLSFRGGNPQDIMTYLDGVPVSPGIRSLSRTREFPAPLSYAVEVGTNAIQSAAGLTGPMSARFGNGQAGALLLQSVAGATRLGIRGSFESDAMFGSGHGPGFTRLQLEGGALLTARLHLNLAGVLDGQRSAESGPGSERFPIFLPAGVDTTVAVPSAINDPFADTTFVDVARFVIARGQCDTFSSSTNPGIADNFGQECHGVRIPSTASSQYQLLGRMEYTISPRSYAWITAVASQSQGRRFDTNLLFIPQDQIASRGWSRMVTLGVHRDLGAATRPWTVNLALSLQRDRAITGALTRESEQNTREGMLFSQLQFLNDFESFPLDDELVRNIHDNIPGSRRSPLDLANTSQYDYIDEFRNSPYGLGGGPERGGPNGFMTLYRENRTVGSGSVGWSPTRNHTIEGGFEFTRFSTGGYSASLTSQAFSDVFIVAPSRSALFLQDHVDIGIATVTAGVRYDRFHSNAARTFVLDTVSSSPNVGTYSYFPTPNSYGAGGITNNGQPLVKPVSDKPRSSLNPRVQVGFVASPRVIVRLGAGRQSQMPDLAMVLSGVNTDLRVTNSNQVFGSDLDMERTTIYEGGIRATLHEGVTFDGSLYHKILESQILERLESFSDPARLGESVGIRHFTNLGLAHMTGLDTRIDFRRGLVGGTLGYSYQIAEAEDGTTWSTSRPHTLTGILTVDVPNDWHQGSMMGSILQNLEAFATLRYMSGTPYTACFSGGRPETALAGEPCDFSFTGEINGARFPSFKQLDLRVTRGFAVGDHDIVAYIDARNVLDFRNVLNVFAVNGETTNPAELPNIIAADSSGFASEAITNSTYGANGEIDLTFGGIAAAGCANWRNAAGTPATPNCVYLIRAEERFGNGDHLFTLAEQKAASQAHYDLLRGGPSFLGAPRRIRLGLEVRF
jgi:hypothetical protein